MADRSVQTVQEQITNIIRQTLGHFRGCVCCPEAAAAIEREIVAPLVEAERERCAQIVSDSWLDPILTGPQAALPEHAPWSDIERLLSAIRGAIRATGGADAH